MKQEPGRRQPGITVLQGDEEVKLPIGIASAVFLVRFAISASKNNSKIRASIEKAEESVNHVIDAQNRGS
ncbi:MULTISPECIES: hypothetical protein [Halomonadaceae]|uniref:hypothetical protein n=1 Tax=Halomonadaceae TaxID=28256 RepID=UPI003CF75408